MNNYFVLAILLLSSILFGCKKNEPHPNSDDKLYSKSITFTTNIATTEFEVINTDTKRNVIKKVDLKPTSQMQENGGTRYVYNETIKVKPSENLRIIFPYQQSRKYITVSVIGGDFSGMASIIPDKVQYLDFKIADKLYD